MVVTGSGSRRLSLSGGLLGYTYLNKLSKNQLISTEQRLCIFLNTNAEIHVSKSRL